MGSKAWWRILPGVLALVLLAQVAPATAQTDPTPSERFEKGLALLKDKGYALLAEITLEGEKPQREKITAYTDMVLLVNKRQPVTLFLLHSSDKQETKLTTLKPNELAAKALGAWLWYKVCAAADLLESCRGAGVIS
ncbi:MAG: hypothetical protein KA072_06720 [Thermoanaerobaculaceae bacterium]|nr:hypothetical protein [Thermoanaerobaculaceae bacterium]MDI9623125.1 hypothetical protein [Acidobacteriota bacterium]NLH10844.1 hypothetical protein [Holophagae bacterium]HPW56568.1 hypothetical protein [Thermoanaerobaculaceae bacterium]